MHLAWIQYQHNSKSAYYLALVIVEKDDRLITLACEDMTDIDIKNIRKMLDTLGKNDISERIEWLRNNIPSYSRAYKEFRKDRVRIDKIFSLTTV